LPGFITNPANLTATVQVIVQPAAPVNLQAAAGDQEVALQWNAVTGADSYTVYTYQGDNAPSNPNDWKASATVITGTSHTVTGLDYGKTYWFTVRALTQGIPGELSPAASAVPLISVTSVETFTDMTVKRGTKANELSLPNQVQAMLANNTMIIVPVTWDGGTPPYNGNASGRYTFSGTLDLPSHVINPANHMAAVQVYVRRPDSTHYPVTRVTSVTLSEEQLILAEEDEPHRLEVKIEPSYATNPVLMWTSSNPEVATVDANGVVTPRKAGKAIITVTAEGYTAECVVTVINTTFIDVPVDHWAASAIAEAVKAGYVSGYPDGTFRPDQKVTREEFIRMAVDAFGLDTSRYKHKHLDLWSFPYLLVASEHHWIEWDEYSEEKNKVSPEGYQSRGIRSTEVSLEKGDGWVAVHADTAHFPMTRFEMAKLAINALGKSVDEDNEWTYSGAVMRQAVDLGLIHGMGNGELAPEGMATRAQAVVVIQRMLTLKNGGTLPVNKAAQIGEKTGGYAG
jgi:hypothetical protein